MIDAMMHHNKQAFTTKDQDNDNLHEALSCAQIHEGAWWFNACFRSHLNGLYYHYSSVAHGHGINWGELTGNDLKYSFKKSTMRIRIK